MFQPGNPAVMSVKQWFRELQPMPLYLMMGLTILFFAVELIASHITHALTLLVDSYHTLCNLIALLGCIITVKVSLLCYMITGLLTYVWLTNY